MIPEKFKLDDPASEKKLDFFVENLLGVEKFSPDSSRLEKYFSSLKEELKLKEIPIVIVAGTNGKGEVSLLLERHCLDNGIYPHVWNSPHVLSVRERMSYGGLAVEAKRLLSAFEKHKELCEHLSYYEFLFFIFCTLSLEDISQHKESHHILILEVGLGGRLDATNFFDADLSILTSISRDHTEFLGEKLSEILDEKIAVSRSGTRLISGVDQKHLQSRINNHCKLQSIELQDLWNTGELSINMNFHERNRSLSAMAMKYLWNNVLKNNDAVKINVIDHVWARPLKVTYKQCQFILLGSHNLDGLRHLAKWTSVLRSDDEVNSSSCELSESYFDEAWLSFSRHDKNDLLQCLGLVFESPCLGKKIYLTSFKHPRATCWNTLKEQAESFVGRNRKKVHLERDFNTLIQRLNSVDDHREDLIPSQEEVPKRVLLAGSYYFLGCFLDQLPADSYQFS